MPEYLRVRQTETGHELTVTRTVYDFAPDAYEVLEGKAATDTGGNPIPAKYKTTVAAAAEDKKVKTAGRSAATQKETS